MAKKFLTDIDLSNNNLLNPLNIYTKTQGDARYVAQTITVNGHALSSNVIISASDITTGTLPHAQLPTLLSGDIPNNSANTSGTATYANTITGGSANQILYQSAINSTSYIAANNNAVLVSGATGIPTMSATLPSGLTVPNLLESVATGVAAAGTTQGTATTVTADVVVVSTVAATSGVLLGAKGSGSFTTIINKGANALNIYPAVGVAIDSLASNIPIVLPVNGWIQFNASSSTQWYSTANTLQNVSLISGTVGIANGGTGATDAYIENVNDQYGPVKMHIQNRTGVNGVLYEQNGTVDLIDFVFKTLTQQSNIRLEARSAYLNNVLNTTGEWQFGPAVLGQQWLVLGSTQGYCWTPMMQFDNIGITGQLTSTIANGTAPFIVTSTTPVANLSIGGNSATSTLANDIAGGASNQILYQYSTNNTSFIPTANNGVLITNGTGVPSISTSLPIATGGIGTNNGFSINTCPVKVHTSSTQAISATTATKVIFGAIDHAPIAAAWNSANNRYIAQYSGIYTVNAAIRYSGTIRNNKVMLYKNGVLVQSLCDDNTSTLANPHQIGSTDIQLAANDYLEIWVYSSAATTIVSSPDVNFCVRQVY